MTDISEIEKKIIDQVEYYFNDVNLTKDKFLRTEIAKEDRWIHLDILLTFNRLKSMTNDPVFLKTALSKSTNNILEIKDNAVRRIVPFVLVENEDIFEKFSKETIFVKGFGSDVTLEVIEDWFKEIECIPKSIHMRKYPRDKKFKGSIFATFSDDKEAETFLKCEAGSKFKENCLIRKWQQEFKADKEEEWNAREEDKKKRQDLQEKARRKDVENQMIKGALLELSNLPKEDQRKAAGEKRKADEDDANNEEENSDKKDTQMHTFKGWVSEKIGDELSKGLWLDIQPDANKGVLRLKTVDSAKRALELFKEKGLMYQEHELVPRLIEGEEELGYWVAFFNAKGNRSHKRHLGNGKRRRRA